MLRDGRCAMDGGTMDGARCGAGWCATDGARLGIGWDVGWCVIVVATHVVRFCAIPRTKGYKGAGSTRATFSILLT